MPIVAAKKKNRNLCFFHVFPLFLWSIVTPGEDEMPCTGWGGSKFGDRGFFRKRGGVNLGWILYSYGHGY